MSVTATAPPALPAELEALMRQLKMPYARALAPELIATARAQRWEPTEIIKALFVEEVTGRSRSMLAIPGTRLRPRSRCRHSSYWPLTALPR
jgi:hypothetical protein